MKRNKNRLILAISFMPKMKKCLFMFLFANLTIFGTLIAQTPQIWPTEISFNYDDNSNTYDALNIRKNASTTISVPEYVKDSRNESCAYIMSQSSRKIKVKFNSNNSNMNYLVKATVISGTGIGNVCEMFVAPCDLNSTVFTVDLSGAVPGSVGKRTFTWKWEAAALPINSPYCPSTCTSVNTTHTFYTLLATPQAPMSTPWADVLDYACVWASGQTSESAIISTLTNSLYNSGVTYDGGQHYTRNSYSNIDLTSLLGDLTNPSSMQMDCRDFANFLHVLTNSLGGSGQYNVIDNISYPYYFCYNYLLPANWSSGTTGCWNFHQIGWFNMTVADASTKVDNDSDPASSPHSWKLAVGDMTLSNYLDKLSEDNLSSVSTGTCTVY